MTKKFSYWHINKSNQMINLKLVRKGFKRNWKKKSKFIIIFKDLSQDKNRSVTPATVGCVLQKSSSFYTGLLDNEDTLETPGLTSPIKRNMKQIFLRQKLWRVNCHEKFRKNLSFWINFKLYVLSALIYKSNTQYNWC